MEKNSLCLCMITKDEAKYIERCIKSTEGLAQEIVIVDTGSADLTVSIAERLGAKVYYYPWDGSFSNARNFGIERAESEWLLLLDADEALDPDALGIIREFINSTDLHGAHLRVRNYTGVYSPDEFILHSAFRLLRNNGVYHFEGEIHEQVVPIDHQNRVSRFTTINAIVHHYGYLTEVVLEKHKRSRNMAILEKQLMNQPNDAFALFNMGNEYLSLNNYSAALTHYKKALEHVLSPKLTFVSHLLFRIVSCHMNISEYDEALKYAAIALGHFPSCTDFEFLRGEILYKIKRYTAAIRSYETCISMGGPPMEFEFFMGCATYRPAFQLGEIHMELEDYTQAIKYFDMTLKFKSDFYAAIYKLGHALNKLYSDKDEVAKQLFRCFVNPKYAPNAVLGADILVEEKLYEQALMRLNDAVETHLCEFDIRYVRGRALLFLKRFDEALPLLLSVCDHPHQAVLRGIRQIGALSLFSAGLVRNDMALMEKVGDIVRQSCNACDYEAVLLLRDIYFEKKPETQPFEGDGSRQLEAMIVVLDMLLRLGEHDLLERMMAALNYVDSGDLLIRLSQLFLKNDLPSLARHYVMRSIKELDFINAAGVSILCRLI